MHQTQKGIFKINDKKEIFKIHNHPKMEQELKVPTGHYIIDEGLFYELLRRFGMRLPETENRYIE